MKIRSEKKVHISVGKHNIPLLVRKNKQSKNYKLTFDKKNLRALISIPKYITFIEGIKFAEENKDWLLSQLEEIYPINYISDGTKLLFDDEIREVIFLNNNENRIYTTKKSIYVIDKKSAHSKRLQTWIKNELLKKVSSIVNRLSNQLDVKTESIIFDNLKKINKTIILITHRLNSLKNVDLIVHLEKGQIFTYSSYEESVKKNPLFNDIEKLKD